MSEEKEQKEEKTDSILAQAEADKKKKQKKQVKSSTFASTLVIIIIVAAIIIGGGYYLQNKAANENKDQAVDQTKEEMQAQIDELNKKISNLEDKDITNQELIERDLPEAAKVVADCSQNFINSYPEFDPKIHFYLEYNNRAYASYYRQGYRLRDICKSNEKFLMFFDSKKSYEDAVRLQKASPEVRLVSSRAVIGLSDKMFFQMNYYPVKIENYNFEQGKESACVFDQFLNDKVLYICINVLEQGNEYIWYSYDSVKKLNQKVRIESPNPEIENETFEPELLTLFSKQAFSN